MGEAGDRISWGAVAAGVVAALAVQVLFAMIGVAAGFMAIDASDGGGVEFVAEAAPFYLVFSGLASLFTGGFVAGRMAGVPLFPSAALHGAIVWSVVTVASFVLAVGGAAQLVGGAARVAGQVGQAAAEAAGGVAEMLPDDPAEAIPDEVVEQFRQALGDPNLSAENARREIQAIYRSVIDPQDRERAMEIVRNAARDVIRDPANALDRMNAALNSLFGEGGVIGEEERQQLVSELGTRFNVPEDQATQMIDNWAASLNQTAEEARAMIEDARADAAELAEEASEAVASAAGWGAAAMLLSLFAACAGALVGRPEDLLAEEARDEAREPV